VPRNFFSDKVSFKIAAVLSRCAVFAVSFFAAVSLIKDQPFYKWIAGINIAKIAKNHKTHFKIRKHRYVVLYPASPPLCEYCRHPLYLSDTIPIA
jgi:hypothetical protein